MQNFIADINTACRCMTYRNTIDHLSKQFYYLAKPFLVFTKKTKHVFIIEAIINYPKGSDAIMGVEMTNMCQTAIFLLLLEINDGPLGVIFYKSDVNRFQYIWTLPVREVQDHRQGSWPTYHLMPIDTKKTRLFYSLEVRISAISECGHFLSRGVRTTLRAYGLQAIWFATTQETRI